jgi:DNA mismatch endonuclease (patch repair protein)
MSCIRSKDTTPEKIVRSLLHSMGYRFKIHVNDLPGKPDIVLPKYKTVIFVHGCFWHRHPECKYAYTPKSRIEFWENKFVNNIKRFKIVKKELERLQWNVFIIWECEIKSTADRVNKLARIISGLHSERQRQDQCGTDIQASVPRNGSKVNLKGMV